METRELQHQSTNVFAYGPVILWERPTQVLASLVLKAGDHVVDVGANTGGLAIALWRQVQPGGRLLAFECNPRMARWISENAAVNGAAIDLETQAAFRVSDEIVRFFVEDSPFAGGSSLISGKGEGRWIEVTTTTIDAACAARNLEPKLIKIDVEGAEVDVLAGAARTISQLRPYLTFERQSGLPPDRDPVLAVQSLNYACFDVNTMEPVTSELEAAPFPSNVFAIPNEHKPAFVQSDGWQMKADHTGETATKWLPAGLHIVCAVIEDAGWSIGELSVYDPSNERIVYFEAPTAHLAHRSCACFPIELQSGGEVRVVLRGDGARLAAIRGHRTELRLGP